MNEKTLFDNKFVGYNTFGLGLDHTSEEISVENNTLDDISNKDTSTLDNGSSNLEQESFTAVTE